MSPAYCCERCCADVWVRECSTPAHARTCHVNAEVIGKHSEVFGIFSTYLVVFARHRLHVDGIFRIAYRNMIRREQMR